MNDDWLALGTVGKAKGTQGAFMFRPYNALSDAFDTVERVRIKDKIYSVDSVRDLPNGIEIKVEGIDSPEAAKLLVNLELFAPRAELPPPQADEVLLADLNGKRVVEDGEDIGEVIGFTRAGSEIYFEVLGKKGEVVPVPSSGPFVVRLEGDTVIVSGVAVLFE